MSSVDSIHVISKACTTCKVIKPASDFYRDKLKPDGLYSRCKECHKCGTAAWAARNAPAKAKHAADYRTRHPERSAATQRASSAKRYLADPEPQKARTRQWYAANKDRAANYHKAYREQNAGRRNAYFADYYQEHAELLKERARINGPIWAKANPDKVIARTVRRREAKLRAIPSWADLQAIDAIYQRCRDICMETGAVHHVDHIVPLQGKTVCGLHVDCNLEILSGPANQSKGVRHWPDMP